MITRIRPKAVLDIARSDVPRPADVVNLISPERFDRYRWYALLVMPALTAVGGRVLWMARSEASLIGEPQCEKLLLVRYPSHRHFLAMTLNPYYLAINALREAGVRRFEAGFTLASHTDALLHRRRRLVGVHFDGESLDRIAEIGSQDGWELVYATRASANLGFLDPPRDTDPNPLGYGQLALFDPGAGDPVGTAARIAAAVPECSVQVYDREPRSAYRPTLRPAWAG